MPIPWHPSIFAEVMLKLIHSTGVVCDMEILGIT